MATSVIEKQYIYSLVSRAAYSDFAGVSDVDGLRAALMKGDLVFPFVTKEFATIFTNRFNFLYQYSDFTSGFSVSVFQDYSGGYIVSFRGTEFPIPNDLAADSKILADGYAGAQHYEIKDFLAKLFQSKESGGAGLSVGTRVNVTGDSLGGHLATFFTGLYYDFVDEVIIFEAPGINSQKRSRGQF